jgi:CubicO group peptidase (beta-lactamase class C family)
MRVIKAAHVSEEMLRELCARTIERLEIAGAQIAICVDDTLVHAEAGVANTELGSPVTADTLFQIGSTTKVYTATLVMQLADQGVVDIDRPVAGYLPGVRLAAGDDWREITPRQLMSMNSVLDNGPYTYTSRGDDSVARYVDLLAEVPLVFSPGSAYGYSNASTRISGRLIEKLTGQCWDEALRDRLLVPAGLTEAASLFEDLPYHRVAVGRLPGGTVAVRPWCHSRGNGPSGSSLAVSARGLVRFGQIFLRRGRAADGTRILSERAVDLMHTPQVDVPSRVFADSWCVGPYRKVWNGIEVYGHSGTTANGSSTLLWIPDHRLTIATTVNTSQRGYPFADAVFDTVLRDWLGLPKPRRPIPDPTRPVDLLPYLGRYRSFDSEYEITRHNRDLVMTLHHTNLQNRAETFRSALRYIGPHRFLPEDDAVTHYHTWDIAFTLGADGRAELLHNGAFAARRTN